LSAEVLAVSLVAASTGGLTGMPPVLRLAFHEGLVQFLIRILGWAAGEGLASEIAAVDDWVAAGMLAYTGLRLLRGAIAAAGEARRLDPNRGLTLWLRSLPPAAPTHWPPGSVRPCCKSTSCYVASSSA
jgi:putative Mn2+ efflux pump MntP